ncbi:hypothetical protein EYF80_021461 [Liparis tanakae]|uniref:Uncharacterized protein n=1 Tax=Liparis tanakae TaxID=230148 RepID=A0A4Z2HRA4_9TELE|nr:hypothetical protein EYF80_021461 [Liparis tanakae]
MAEEEMVDPQGLYSEVGKRPTRHRRYCGPSKVLSLLMFCRNLDITVPSINQININTGKEQGLAARMAAVAPQMRSLHCLIHQSLLCTKLGVPITATLPALSQPRHRHTPGRKPICTVHPADKKRKYGSAKKERGYPELTGRRARETARCVPSRSTDNTITEARTKGSRMVE